MAVHHPAPTSEVRVTAVGQQQLDAARTLREIDNMRVRPKVVFGRYPSWALAIHPARK